MSFKDLNLLAQLLRAIEEQGYSEPTPIQKEAIPIILEGSDLMAGAQTGSGKTAGFTLPLLQHLMKRYKGATPTRRTLRGLILVPTRELAAQVATSVRDYGKYLPLKSTVIFGGVNINPQIRNLRIGVDIVIATPGRLLDHVTQKTVDLSRIEVVVLDEADRMLDMGFIHDIRKILALLPKKRQSLLFSATFSEEIRNLARGLLTSPKTIEAARQTLTAELIEQVIHPVDNRRKQELLAFLIHSESWKQVLIFTRTKHGANKLAQFLSEEGISATAFHSNKSQSIRTKALSDFKKGALRALVATDIASRGIDIDKLPHVVNFELPHVPEDYVHRIGRTGRAGKEGKAVSLVCVDERKLLRDIEKLLKCSIPNVIVRIGIPRSSISG
ncbi:MAG: DEAD/DEAH box helicase [Simkania negevensis]|nr:DEAD/DEAH box helicase [Simkania negevensis]